jgi:cellulose synthase/poly-beta-1,6-N-acetylglucosamine synthase-like glycosyltransferase
MSVLSGLAWFLLALDLVAAVFLWRLRRGLVRLAHCRSRNDRAAGEIAYPPDQETAVILCVRGADPSLPSCLEGLVSQTHTRYAIHAVTDHASDPAQPWLSQYAARDARVHLHLLTSPPAIHRGLKVTAILQVLRQLPADIQHVVFIDSDVIPHPEWLREMTAPLVSQEVVATTGTRWFIPGRDNFGSVVRQEWNLYANAIIVQQQMLWGGSFATRWEELQQSLRGELWSDTLCEDTCLADLLRREGRPAVIVPAAAMINRETCSLRGACDFMTRQLVFTRMYLTTGRRIVLFGLVFSLLCLGSTAAVAVLAWTGPGDALVVALVAYLLLHGSVLALEQVGRQLPAVLRGTGHARDTTPFWIWVCAQFVCAGVSLVASVRALMADRLTWRGIQYRIRREAPRIEMVQYRPFAEVVGCEHSAVGTSGGSI